MDPEVMEKKSRQANAAMYVLDVLRHDIEAVGSILRLLNDRGSVGWRNFVAHDFTLDEIIPVLEALQRQGLIQPLVEDEASGELVESVEIGNRHGPTDAVWFLLTKKGRQVVEAWTPPPSLEDHVLALVQYAPASLSLVWPWLSGMIEEALGFSEFAQLIDSLLERDLVILWQMDGEGHLIARCESMPYDQAGMNPSARVLEEKPDLSAYVLTIGPRAENPPEPDVSFVSILNPTDVLVEIGRSHPALSTFLVEVGASKHVLIDAEGRMLLLAGEDPQEMIKLYSSAQIEREWRFPVRSIRLSASGRVIGDQYLSDFNTPLA